MLQSSEHARLLVYDGHPDAIAGVLHAKDMLAGLTGDETSLARADAARGLRARGEDPRPPAARLPARAQPSRGRRGRIRRNRRASSRWRTSWSRSSARSGTSTTPTKSAPIAEAGEDQLARCRAAPRSPSSKRCSAHRFDREDVSTVGGLVLAEFGRVPRAGRSHRARWIPDSWPTRWSAAGCGGCLVRRGAGPRRRAGAASRDLGSWSASVSCSPSSVPPPAVR